MLKRYMHKRERHFAMLEDDRVVHPFDWGVEYITDRPNGTDPRKLFSEYSKNTLANSEDFFFSPEITDYRQQSSPPYTVGGPTGNTGPSFVPERGVAEGRGGSPVEQPQTLTWTSGIKTPTPENNTAYATYFPNLANKKTARTDG